MTEMPADGTGYVDQSGGELFAFGQSGPYMLGTAHSCDPPVPGREAPSPKTGRGLSKGEHRPGAQGHRHFFFLLVYKNKTLLLCKKVKIKKCSLE